VVSRFKDTVTRARLMLGLLCATLLLFRAPTFAVELQWKWRPLARITKRAENTEVFFCLEIGEIFKKIYFLILKIIKIIFNFLKNILNR
jgi:hypothetical protein